MIKISFLIFTDKCFFVSITKKLKNISMISMGRIKVLPIISRIVLPEKCPEIYTELCTSKDFPSGSVFDWRNI